MFSKNRIITRFKACLCYDLLSQYTVFPVYAMTCYPNTRYSQYFAFPQINLMLQPFWISVCRRKDPINIKNDKICDSILHPTDLSGISKLSFLTLKAGRN
uniref:Uncharacterized protein n=1 Tax=Lepeophtheirus salmonis TaxID=72036 RepID=A0A0K2VIG3_LEPSM